MLKSKRPTESSYHIPVLLEEVIDGLRIREDGVYVDVTFGGGGHAKPILDRMNAKGRLFGFDQDIQAAGNVPDDGRFTFIHANFRYLKHFMLYYGISHLDGVLADLGVSSHHFDDALRGFSYRFDGEIDMRMNRGADKSAQHVFQNYSAAQLQEMFSAFGEVRNAKSLAQLIVEGRTSAEIKTAEQFIAVIERCIRGDRKRYLSQVFQAVRMEVNDEMNALLEMLEQAAELLCPGGRMAVLSYHSIEDRAVKNFFKTGNTAGIVQQDSYGNRYGGLDLVNKRPIEAGKQERMKNTRSASAKLRIAQKPK